MNWVDWVILATLAVSVLAGLMKGAVRSVFSIIGLVAGFVVASRESGAMGVVLSGWMPEAIAGPLGFVLVFLGIALAFALAGWLLRNLLKTLLLGWFDRLLGVLLGVLRAGAIVGVCALAIEGAGSFPAARESVTFPWALETGRLLLALIPQETLERLDWDDLQSRIPRGVPALDEDGLLS
jgi:membrane protein required for colicin V production